MSSLNLQRNSEVYFSTIDLSAGVAPANMTPSNTWRLEVLAGYALTASSATQDITSMESGLSPDRSQQLFNTAINPVDWNFQTYIRPTGVITPAGPNLNAAATTVSGNVKPVADWFLWQSLVSNTKAATGGSEQSVWSTGGKLYTSNTGANAIVGVSPSRTNFATAVENHLYFVLDNVIYQVSNATVNQATIDAGIDAIATTTWTGQGTFMSELTGTTRDNAVSVFGGIYNNATVSIDSASATNLVATASYHPYNTMNVAATTNTNSFIKNRLSTIQFTHATSATAAANTYTFPVTALTFDYTNNISYLTPEELSTLNRPIGQFLGTRAVTGTAKMYLRNDNQESSQFLRNIMADARTSHAANASAILNIGGATGPYVQLAMPSVQFQFPKLAIEDVLSMTVDFTAQEPLATKGTGGEVTITAVKV